MMRISVVRIVAIFASLVFSTGCNTLGGPTSPSLTSVPLPVVAPPAPSSQLIIVEPSPVAEFDAPFVVRFSGEVAVEQSVFIEFQMVAEGKGVGTIGCWASNGSLGPTVSLPPMVNVDEAFIKWASGLKVYPGLVIATLRAPVSVETKAAFNNWKCNFDRAISVGAEIRTVSFKDIDWRIKKK